MLNYVGIQLASFMVDTTSGPLAEHGASYAQSPLITASARLPILIPGTSLHAGLLLAVALAVALQIVVSRTPFGFRLRLFGASPSTARYAGVSTSRQIVSVMLLGGGLAGLAGASEILGLRYRLFDNFSPGYGYDAIAVALVAGCSPLGAVPAAAFFGALRAGANRMQQAVGIEASLVLVIQALAVLFLLARPTIRWGSAGRYEQRGAPARVA
jgi:simple sugar transport system permease protein